MHYCSRAEFEDRFGKSLLADLEYGRPNALAEAITDADSLIDSYIAARYALPLKTVPPVLASTARDLIRYSLDNDPTPAVQSRRDEAVKYLATLAQGRTTLGLTQTVEPESLDTAEIHSDGHVFKRSTSQGFI